MQWAIENSYSARYKSQDISCKTTPILLNTLYKVIVQLGLDFKLNTKKGLGTTHHPPTHHKLLDHFQAY